jgi:hypothetical protein
MALTSDVDQDNKAAENADKFWRRKKHETAGALVPQGLIPLESPVDGAVAHVDATTDALHKNLAKSLNPSEITHADEGTPRRRLRNILAVSKLHKPPNKTG